MTATTSMGARAADGAVVSARLFAPEQPAGATHLVLLAGAFAVRQRYYARFARDLVERGLAVVTVDYRGVGESRHSMPPGSGRRARSGKAPMRQHPARATDWVLDLDAAVHAARHHIPDAPLVVVGHSFGGQVLPLMAHADEISRVVTVGTQFAHPSLWQGWERVRMETILRAAIPGLVATAGYLPGWSGIGEDVPGRVAADWARWCRSRRYLLDHVDGAEQAFSAFTAPVEAIAVTDDDYAPPAGVELYASFLPNSEVSRIAPEDLGLSTLGHFGPFRPDARVLWEQVAAALVDGAREVA